MLQFISKKLKNQKLLNGCLFFGIVILIAMFSLIPMFERGALDDVIIYNFETKGVEEARFPATIQTSGKIYTKEAKSIAEVNAVIDETTSKWNRYFEIPVLSTEKIITISAGRIEPDMAGERGTIQTGIFNDMDKNLKLIDIDEDYKEEPGVLPCYMSKYTMEDKNLSVGETLELTAMENDKGETPKLRIIGIAEPCDNGDYYWYDSLRKNKEMLILREEYLDKMIAEYGVESVSYEVYEMLDYRAIYSSNIKATNSYLSQFGSLDMQFKSNFDGILDDYMETAKQVKVTVLSILFPLFALILIFIYMISDRIRVAEEGEINVLRSRGISRFTIIRQYILQSFIITLAAVIPGVMLGYFMCKAGAASVDFLSFKWKPTPSYTLRPELLLYVAAAFPVAMIICIIPIIKASKNTILSNRGKKSGTGKNSFIEKYYIDIILVAVSCYLLYNYNRQKDVMVAEILSGKVADPMCLIDSELFTFGAAFLMIRLSRLIITAIYKAGQKKWKPATLAAFLEVIRTRRKSWVISVFLIITIAMGIYNANLAKTVNRNKRERLVNNIGAEAVLSPACRLVAESESKGGGWSLLGMDYSELTKMKDEGLVDRMTKVYRTEKLSAVTHKGKAKDVLLMGIDTKEFGETAVFDEMLNDHHWYKDLNELAMISNGVIISGNMAEKFDLAVGDSIELKLESPLSDDTSGIIYSLDFQVVGIVDAFPGYNRYFYNEEDEKTMMQERYLVVVNSATLTIAYGEIPPEVWIDMSEDVTIDDIAAYLDSQEIKFNKLIGMDDEIDKVFSSAVLLITNGLFNISFIVSMVICMIGFLIYWLTSIHARQMYFGVYRAMGLGMKSVNRMLVKEHVFSTMTSLISSVIVGALTSAFFIKLLSLVYLPDKHTIPLKIYMSYSGFIRIGIMMAAVIILCMFIIVRFIKRLNITEAIKMGEE